jgi:hypothetical protein
VKEKKPFKSKWDNDMNWVYFMAYGVIKSIYMSAFEEGVLTA